MQFWLSSAKLAGMLRAERIMVVLGVLCGACCCLAQEENAPGTELSTNAPSYRIPGNRILEFVIPITSTARLSVGHSQNEAVETVRAAIAVPLGFDPELPAPILIVNGTSDGTGSSIRVMPAFTNVALRLGWVVIAADGPFGKPKLDNPPWRWAMNSTVLDHLHKTWPGSKRWPVAVAGVSGGGKWAAVMGAILAQKGYNLVGVFEGAVNQDLASEAAKLYDPATRYRSTPFFLSSGTEDGIATPEHHEEVQESMRKSGFKKVRLEKFKGGHALSESQLRTALTWFLEEYARSAAESQPKEPAAAAPRD